MKKLTLEVEIVPDPKSPTLERRQSKFHAEGLNYSEIVGILEYQKFDVLRNQRKAAKQYFKKLNSKE